MNFYFVLYHIAYWKTMMFFFTSTQWLSKSTKKKVYSALIILFRFLFASTVLERYWVHGINLAITTWTTSWANIFLKNYVIFCAANNSDQDNINGYIIFAYITFCLLLTPLEHVSVLLNKIIIDFAQPIVMASDCC